MEMLVLNKLVMVLGLGKMVFDKMVATIVEVVIDNMAMAMELA
jgi:hypothetical protein